MCVCVWCVGGGGGVKPRLIKCVGKNYVSDKSVLALCKRMLGYADNVHVFGCQALYLG